MQKLQPSSSTSITTPQNNNLDIPIFGASQMGAPIGQLSPSLSPDNNNNHKRPGIPPSHPNNPHSLPYPHMMSSSRSNSNSGSYHHSRSLSQPSVFSLDCLPPLSPSNPLSYRESSISPVSDPVSTNVFTEERVGNSPGLSIPSPGNRVNTSRAGENLPPRKGHRRSSSDTPLGFSAMIQSSPQLLPIGSRGMFDMSVSGRENSVKEKPIELVKRESEWNNMDGSNYAERVSERKTEGEIADDLFNEYMNLDNMDTLNSSGTCTEDKDLDSRASGSKTHGCDSSDNEVESRGNGNSISLQGTASSSISSERREGVKRSANGRIAPTVRHQRSVSMDSFLMGDLDFDDESLTLPLENQASQVSPGGSMDGNLAKISLELNGEFSDAEVKKIMANDKLAEIALADPKRAKRILANRQSAARSKERKMRYIAELEQKVQTLQTEATTLSAQVTILQRDSTGLTNQNNELKFRLQAMEQQAHLKDALNEALAGEVQRLKIAAAEVGGEAHLSSCMAQQLSINPQMFQLQPNQHNVYQLQHQQQAQQQQQRQQSQQQQPQCNQLRPGQRNTEK